MLFHDWTDPVPVLNDIPNVERVEITAPVSTDVTQTIQAAIDSLNGEPGVILLPKGDLVISEPLVLSSGVTLQGAGSQQMGGSVATIEFTLLNFKPAEAFSGTHAIEMVGQPGALIRNSAIRNLTIIGDGDASDFVDQRAAGGVLVRDARDCVIENVHFDNLYHGRHFDHVNSGAVVTDLASVGYGVRLSENAVRVVVRNCSFTGCNVNVGMTDEASHNLVTGCWSHGVATAWLFMDDAVSNCAHGNAFESVVPVSLVQVVGDSSHNSLWANRFEGVNDFSDENLSHSWIKGGANNLFVGNQSLRSSDSHAPYLATEMFVEGISHSGGRSAIAELQAISKAELSDAGDFCSYRMTAPYAWNQAGEKVCFVTVVPIGAWVPGDDDLILKIDVSGGRRDKVHSTIQTRFFPSLTPIPGSQAYTAQVAFPSYTYTDGSEVEHYHVELERVNDSSASFEVASVHIAYQAVAHNYSHEDSLRQ